MLIQVCRGKSCSERHSQYIASRLHADKSFYGYPDDVIIEDCFCQGRCKEWSTVVFDGNTEVHMNPIKASEMLRKKVAEAKRKIQKN